MNKQSDNSKNTCDCNECNCECNCKSHKSHKSNTSNTSKKCFGFFKSKCDCECQCNTPEIKLEVPVEDMEPIIDDKTLLKKRGDPFKNGKALLIGINYTGTGSQLNGCINDVYNMYTYLTKIEKFDPKCIRILVDEPNTQDEALPTRKNILEGIRWVVNNNEIGDDCDPISLFIHYSGHGSWTWDRNSDESDHKDETICPLDYSTNGLIVDDQLRKVILTPIKDASNIQLTCVFDCCHSGTILDMRYNVRVGLNKHRPNYSRIAVTEDKKYAKSKCRVNLFSGCLDKQYSADAYINRQSQGFMTFAFLFTIKKFKKEKRKLTYKKFITQLQSIATNKGYDQIPQLTFNKFINLKERFSV